MLSKEAAGAVSSPQALIFSEVICIGSSLLHSSRDIARVWPSPYPVTLTLTADCANSSLAEQRPLCILNKVSSFGFPTWSRNMQYHADSLGCHDIEWHCTMPSPSTVCSFAQILGTYCGTALIPASQSGERILQIIWQFGCRHPGQKPAPA